MEYLFVVTYGRSGSTVLLNLLNAIDGYCIRGENGGVLNALAASHSQLKKGREANAGHNEEPHTPWYGISETDPDRWAQSLAEVFTRDILQTPPGTRVAGFKEIRYTPGALDEDAYRAMIDFQASAFPTSRFIFNTRDSQEVAKSGWWPHSKIRGARDVHELVAICDKRFGESCATLGERAFLIDYADYNGKPEGFRPLLSWLGEEVPRADLERVCARKLDHAPTSPHKMAARKSGLRRFFGR
ncbi:MAG: sulfotransferase [Pseudomonadota bacterium]